MRLDRIRHCADVAEKGRIIGGFSPPGGHLRPTLSLALVFDGNFCSLPHLRHPVNYFLKKILKSSRCTSLNPTGKQVQKLTKSADPRGQRI
jgi:hypothetical protein